MSHPDGQRPPEQPQSGLSGGHAVLGAVLFAVANAIVGVVVFVIGMSYSEKSDSAGGAVFAGFAVLSALAAFGGGALLMRTADRNKRGLGLGLMIGWALVSLLTGGVCTGAGIFFSWIPGFWA
ncbi:MAG: hypothetical protein ACRDUS_07810 [Mycobacterium sp.]